MYGRFDSENVYSENDEVSPENYNKVAITDLRKTYKRDRINLEINNTRTVSDPSNEEILNSSRIFKEIHGEQAS